MKKNWAMIKSIINYILTVISWTLFVLLICCALFLAYYFVSSKMYASKGSGYEPPFSIYTIASGSMVPNLKVYDIIINVKTKKPEEIKVGDIITFVSTNSNSMGMTITHRVAKIDNSSGEYKYTTKGDANLSSDEKEVLYNNIIGKATMKIPKLGYVQRFVGSKFGWLVVVVLPALYIIIKDVLKIVKISKLKKTAEKENTKLVLLTENPEELKATNAKLQDDLNSLLKEINSEETKE